LDEAIINDQKDSERKEGEGQQNQAENSKSMNLVGLEINLAGRLLCFDYNLLVKIERNGRSNDSKGE
jgi:hypothetical protein